ncbi:GNAT family protein [Marispirochaeta aestuarii]|uniref:GNAT family N-acetyltransferase n=1 Tax=Marispirochaeta aestuarii TaxID=1963862 RepID=UPI002ABE404B|nr:GNAT family protein [Marispirochaeta aestuarii]
MIILEKFDQENIPQLLSWLEKSDAKFLLQFAGPRYKFPLNEEQLMESLKSKDYMLLKAIDTETRRIIGHCQFMRIDTKQSKASIGRILIDPEIRGNGFGLQLINEMKIYAKEELELSKIDLRVFDFNTSAFRCYLKAGFIETSVHENHIPEFNETWKSITMECDL